MDTVQDIFSCWYPAAKKIEITQEESVKRTPSVTDRVGVFFSGGVDSWHTFLRHKDEITDLIFVHGFDIFLGETSLFEKTRANLQQAAEYYGKNLIIVKTNMREFMEPEVAYQKVFGPALAGVGHALSDHFGKIYLSGSETYAAMFPDGSHPLLDPFWSSEAFELVPDGWGTDRLHKVEEIATSPAVLQTLRVCWKNPDGEYNCGKCEKCLRTMVELYAVGALGECKTFKEPLNLKRLARMPIPREANYYFLEVSLRYLETRPQFKPTIKALQRAVRRARWENPLKDFKIRQKRIWRQRYSGLYGFVKRLIKRGNKKPSLGSKQEYWKKRL